MAHLNLLKTDTLRSGLIGLLASFCLGTLAGCDLSDLSSDPNYVPPPEPTYATFDRVKLIASAISDGNSPETFLRSEYEVGPARRLLLKYKGLLSKVGEVKISTTERVKIELTLLDASDAELAKTALTLCPLSKKWMMLASWDSAFPYPSGRWNASGGDYESSCVSVSEVKDRQVVFDATLWFENYPRGRGQDHGLILLATHELRIYGDSAAGDLSPRVHWVRKPQSGSSR